MKYQETKFKNGSEKYSVLIGNNILSILPKKINNLCPATTKIAIIIDKEVPKKFSIILKKYLLNTSYIFLHLKLMKKIKTLKRHTIF